MEPITRLGLDNPTIDMTIDADPELTEADTSRQPTSRRATPRQSNTPNSKSV